MAEKSSVKLIANNKKAYHDYFILEKYEAGISLAGTEVKSIRMGKCSIKEAYVEIKAGQMNIVGIHKYEIRKLGEKIREKGYTLMPLQVYLKGSLVKVEIGLAKGKKLYDKRADIAAKDAKREAQREFKIRNF